MDAFRTSLILTFAAATVLAAGCGDSKKEKGASQTAARVNKSEITVHQINYLLQQQRNLKPEQAEAASRQVLERLVDQELALQKAEDMKVDRDARVMQQIDAARREIVARAYFEKVGEAVPAPSADEVRAYYESKPPLFKERRVYALQELTVEAKPDQLAELRERLSAAKTMTEFVDFLKSAQYRFAGNQAVRAAEQLPLASLDGFARMRDGQALLNPTPTGAQIVVLVNSRSEPVSLEQATPAIQQFLMNEKRRELVAASIKEMRASAKIEYMGKFNATAETAPGAASAASAPPAAAPVPAAPPQAAAPAPAASAASGAKQGLDASTITKGMGLK